MEQQQQIQASTSLGARWKKRGVGALIAMSVLVAGSFFWMRNATRIETDNAFIEAPIHTIAPRISGAVVDVQVKDNQLVHQGDVLVVLDDRDARAEVNKAEAELVLARNETGSDQAQVESARAEVARTRAQAVQAGLDLQRAEVLFQQKVIPQEQLDRVRTNRTVAEAQARESERRLQKEVATVGEPVGSAPGALVAKRQAELDAARLRLSYTRMCAPVDGYVTRKSVEQGNWVQPGQALMAVVALDETWITANYKESQLADVQPGLQVLFTVDAYPGAHFTGRVESVMAGTGAAFSLLPPENATGNYVKVTQRIPVKIAIDPVDPATCPLRVGMSVAPTILVPKTLEDVFGIPSGPLKLTAQVLRGDDVLTIRQ